MILNRSMSLLCALTLSLICGSATAQGLPPTNMGKFVHQPGDNQYSVKTQMERHGTSYIDTMGTGSVFVGPARGVGGGGGGAAFPPAYTCAPPPPKGPDISLEPITADEPIPLPGFPPMPMALDLPVQIGLGGGGAGGSWFKQGGGGGGGNSGSSNNGYQGSHQHYGHYEPGAFVKRNNNNGGGEGNGGGGGGGYGGGGGGGGDYNPTPPVQKSGYRVATPPPIGRSNGDVYSANTGTTGKGATSVPLPGRSGAAGAEGGPAYTGVSGRDIKALGKAPELDNDGAAGAPEAPSPVLVNQSRSQDLSLPDDEFVSGNFKDGKGKRFIKRVGKQGKNFGRTMLRQTGVPIPF